MKYNVFINQKLLVEKYPQIDVVGAFILEVLKSYSSYNGEKMKKLIDDGDEFTWVNYASIVKELPILKIKSLSVITKRVEIFKKLGLIKTLRKTNSDGSPMIYFRFTELAETLDFEGHSPQETSSFPDKNELILPGERNILLDNINTKGSSEELATPSKRSLKKKEKTHVWIQNEEYIKDNLERYKEVPIMKDGVFGWGYLINQGRTTPDKLFGAIYWQEKERLSEGIFAYKFAFRERAWECFSSEQKFAAKLASILTVNEFKEKIIEINEKAWNERLEEYDYEWKLSTILKNLRS